MSSNPPPDMDSLERALIAAYNAVDSRGLKIRLINPRSLTPADIALAAQKTIHQLSRDGVALGGDDPDKGERNRAANIRLCANILFEARAQMVRR